MLLRPLFPANYFDQVQVIVTVYSVDKEHAPQTFALLASSIGITISKIPFMGPVGVVEMARVDGKWVVNPKYTESLKADANIIVAGTKEGIINGRRSMVMNYQKKNLLMCFLKHMKKLKKLLHGKIRLRKEVGKEKAPVNDEYNWQHGKNALKNF